MKQPIQRFEAGELKEHEPVTVLDLLSEAIYRHLFKAESYKRIVRRMVEEGVSEGPGQLMFFVDVDVSTNPKRKHPDYDWHLHMPVKWTNHTQPLGLEIEVRGHPQFDSLWYLESEGSAAILYVEAKEVKPE